MNEQTHTSELVTRNGGLDMDNPRARLLALANRAALLAAHDFLQMERRDVEAVTMRLISTPRRAVVFGEPSRGKTRLVRLLADGRAVDRAKTNSERTTASREGSTESAVLRAQGSMFEGLLDEILDTPGLCSGDALVDEFRPTILTSSIAILVTSGTAAFGLSERDLLLALMAEKLGRALVVAVTMLDRVDAEDHDRVLGTVTRKVRAVAPAATVIRADDVAALRARLVELLISTEKARDDWDHTTADLLAELVTKIRDSAQDRADSEALTNSEIESRRREAQRRTNRVALEWEGLLADIEGRRLALVDRLRATLENRRDKVLQQLVADVRMSPDPGTWWQKDLQRELGRELEGATRLLERRISDGLSEDITWLAAEIETRTGESPLVLQPEAFGLEVLRLHAPAPGMPNLALVRSGTLAAASILFTAKVAMSGSLNAVLPAAALSGAAYVIGALVTKGGTRRAVEIAAAALPPMVESHFEKLFEEVQRAVLELFRLLRLRTAQARDDWTVANPSTAPAVSLPEWGLLRSQAQHLLTDIQAFQREAWG